jgi:hypothetical protein
MQQGRVDLSFQSDADVRAHQMEQARRITATLTPKHHPNLQRELQDLRSSLESLAPQLYGKRSISHTLFHSRVVC